ncbi:MAG: MBL fold metallo-hydrolase [Rhodoplanes sp.]|uniref:MBL fold metallo-hydrolase n=1 Tax=Rhodoplanes sp. TaxID=1968906 RepID=UPI0017F4AF9B|nr:MBL fold metallo-hydrolase [Rhodoplanes sp.]NVO13356.1 MBL fold metallo-hydrolase [Rhodoplanes sp.]
MPSTRRGLLLGLSGLAAAAATLFTARARAARYYDGPVSDHFDGVFFRDPHGAPPKNFADLARWWASRGGEPWPDRAPSPHVDQPPARVDGDALRVVMVGHASVLVQTAGHNLLIDPVWSERASPVDFAGPKRVNDPGIPFEALPRIDTVLVSHGHYDHLDVDTLSRLVAAHRPRIVTPLGNDAAMAAHDPAIVAETYDWHDRVELAENLAVTLVPLRHWSARGLLDRNKALWAGFVLETPAGRIYHVSDSGYGDGFRFREARERYGPFRLAVLPIGAYEPRWFMRDQHMNPAEAVQALQDCGAELALAHHHGTFKLTDEAIDAPARDLGLACAAAEIPPERFRVLKPGEAWEL